MGQLAVLGRLRVLPGSCPDRRGDGNKQRRGSHGGVYARELTTRNGQLRVPGEAAPTARRVGRDAFLKSFLDTRVRKERIMPDLLQLPTCV